MEAPKCKICGERHSLGQCGLTFKFVAAASNTGKPTATITRAGITQKAEIIGPNGLVQTSGDLKAGDSFTLKSKFDRVAYQREYMRKRRAKIKD